MLCVIVSSQLANFLAAKQTLLEADNVINTYNYSNLLTAICKYAPVFVVKVSRPCFSTRPQGAREKLDVWGRDYPAPSRNLLAGRRTRAGTRLGQSVQTWSRRIFLSLSLLPLEIKKSTAGSRDYDNGRPLTGGG